MKAIAFLVATLLVVGGASGASADGAQTVKTAECVSSCDSKPGTYVETGVPDPFALFPWAPACTTSANSACMKANSSSQASWKSAWQALGVADANKLLGTSAMMTQFKSWLTFSQMPTPLVTSTNFVLEDADEPGVIAVVVYLDFSKVTTTYNNVSANITKLSQIVLQYDVTQGFISSQPGAANGTLAFWSTALFQSIPTSGDPLTFEYTADKLLPASVERVNAYAPIPTFFEGGYWKTPGSTTCIISSPVNFVGGAFFVSRAIAAATRYREMAAMPDHVWRAEKLIALRSVVWGNLITAFAVVYSTNALCFYFTLKRQ